MIAIAAAFAVLPVLGTPYLSDDQINRLMPLWLAKPARTRLYFIWQNNLIWMRGAHRFFPGAIALSTYVFSTFTTLVAYKSFLVVLLGVVMLTWGLAIRRSVGRIPAWIGVAALVSCWEFRYTVTYDGLTGFSGLVPWTMLLIGVVIALLVRRPQPRASVIVALVAAGVIWTLAVVTYEYAVILAPGVAAVAWIMPNDRRWRAASAAVVGSLAAGAAIMAALLHLHARGPIPPEWALSLRPIPWLTTSAKQLVSAMPLSEYWIRAGASPHLRVPAGVVVGTVALAALVVVALICLWNSWSVEGDGSFKRMGVVGLWFWIAPALLTGATLRWQQVEAWGQSYVPVLFETLGFSLVVVGLLGGARARFVARGGWARYGAISLLVLLGIALATTSALNFSMVYPG